MEDVVEGLGHKPLKIADWALRLSVFLLHIVNYLLNPNPAMYAFSSFVPVDCSFFKQGPWLCHGVFCRRRKEPGANYRKTRVLFAAISRLFKC
jgi:hypothetical protein